MNPSVHAPTRPTGREIARPIPSGLVRPSRYRWPDDRAEMAKLGPGHILLTLGLPIGQIRFETLSSPCERGYGHLELRSHYQGSTGSVPSRARGSQR